jgi:transcriptional regulator GlxA family with amidase domain
MQVSIVAFDRFTDIDVFMPWDLLNRARAAGARDWQVRILGKTSHVTSVAGLQIPTHGPLSETASSAAVIFASGVGIEDCLKDVDFLDALALNERSQLIGSMCAGAMILAHKGLLEGRTATTYPTYMARLAQYPGVQPVEEAFVRHGNVATAGGCLAAQLLCQWVMETLAGRDVSDAVLASILPVGAGCKAFAGWGDPAAARTATKISDQASGQAAE